MNKTTGFTCFDRQYINAQERATQLSFSLTQYLMHGNFTGTVQNKHTLQTKECFIEINFFLIPCLSLCFVYSWIWIFLINGNMTQMFLLPEVSLSDPPKGPKASFHLSDLWTCLSPGPSHSAEETKAVIKTMLKQNFPENRYFFLCNF